MELYPFQQEALEAVKNQDHVAFYYDMGLGKTFMGAEKLHQIGNTRNLVVCQKSKIKDWLDHFHQHYDWEVHDLTNQRELRRFIERDGVVGVINYDLVFRRKELQALHGFALMLDESSLICNEQAKRSKAILRMHPDQVVLLSGTPTAGKYEKLWSQCRLLGWKITKTAYWNSYVEYQWIDYGGQYMHQEVTGYKNVEHLKEKLREHGALFKKTSEVLTLPEQVEQIIPLERTAEYKKFAKSGYLILKDGTELVGDNTLTKMLYMRQLCGSYHKDKMQAVRELIESSEERWIIFYNWNKELDALRNMAKGMDRPVSVVNGKEKDLRAYEEQNDSITLIQYQAGAYGLNLQKAQRIIYFTLPLGKGSCDQWEQSKKRIHRIGQSGACFYYYPLVQNSIETRNLAALKEGKDYTDKLFEMEGGDG